MRRCIAAVLGTVLILTGAAATATASEQKIVRTDLVVTVKFVQKKHDDTNVSGLLVTTTKAQYFYDNGSRSHWSFYHKSEPHTEPYDGSPLRTVLKFFHRYTVQPCTPRKEAGEAVDCEETSR
jgi:hypothetical protein